MMGPRAPESPGSGRNLIDNELAATRRRYDAEAAETRKLAASIEQFDPYTDIEPPPALTVEGQAIVAEMLACTGNNMPATNEKNLFKGSHIAAGTSWDRESLAGLLERTVHLIDDTAPCLIEDGDGATWAVNRRGEQKAIRYGCLRDPRCERHGPRNCAIAAAWIVHQTGRVMYRHRVTGDRWGAFLQAVKRHRKTETVNGAKIPVQVYRWGEAELFDVWLTVPIGPAERFAGGALVAQLARSLAWRATLTDSLRAGVTAPRSSGLGNVKVTLPTVTGDSDWTPTGYVTSKPLTEMSDAIAEAGWNIDRDGDTWRVTDAPLPGNPDWEIFCRVAGLIHRRQRATIDEPPIETYRAELEAVEEVA